MPSVRIRGSDIKYEVVRRDVKYPRLEFKTGNLLLVLPKEFRSHEDLLKRHRDWIFEKHSLISAAIRKARKEELNLNRTNAEFRDLAYSYAKATSEELKLNISGIRFRKMKSKWGSCSPRKNLTLNTLLKYLPEDMINYIIFHEMVHLVEKRHNERFWRIISEKFGNFREKEEKLLIYWFLIQKFPDVMLKPHQSTFHRHP